VVLTPKALQQLSRKSDGADTAKDKTGGLSLYQAIAQCNSATVNEYYLVRDGRPVAGKRTVGKTDEHQERCDGCRTDG